jgi:Lrp/AsnC family leucine-responsive transcriptional regulator
VGLSSPRVGERVRRLEEAGIIEGYHAAVSVNKLGYHLSAFILARPVGPDARFAKLAAERPEILDCHRVTGDVSFVTRAAVKDIKQLESVLNHLEPSTTYIATLLVLSTAFTRHVNVDTADQRLN